ncbi:ABC transporter permease [Segetibacter aerophilus]|uniref:ABC transporter permease n=1 Tax=Segetibacter aerophilus TaxID=670293 RepID=A0A512BB77_9BACT|nr:ABC transporter permease [Segetibacter aerophilus]GEO09218.1 ABC transporter permease [Segetibacter aerophilus]
MFKSYFKTAWRNLWNNKLFSLINVFGLALGIAVFVFIMQYVSSEWNANRFNKNYNRLYRTNVQDKDGNAGYLLPSGFAPIIKNNIAGIQECVRVAEGIGSGVLTITGQNKPDEIASFREDKIAYVDGSFLEVFTYPIIAGTPSLREPKTLAISENLAKKYFNDANPIGKTLTVSNQFGNTLYTINAVFKDMSEQSDIKANILLSLHTLESAANRDGNDWADPNGTNAGFTSIYVLLKEGINSKQLGDQITRFIRSINPDSKDDRVALQPFSELHLAPSFNYPFQTFGSLLLVTVFSVIAFLILLIAWVNYINLSTAQSINRAREAGVRKVLGARRFQLITQYLTETFIVTMAAVILALLLVNSFQPLFNEFTGKQYSLSTLNPGKFWINGLAMIIAGSILAGGYVAFVLSSYKPIKTIRGKIENVGNAFSLRKSLVVFQFTISIVFIIAVVVVYNQLQYMKTENLGMNLKQLLIIKGPTVSSDGQAKRNLAFKNQLTQLPFVEKLSASNNVPGIGYNFSANGITSLNPQPGDDQKGYSMFIADERFFDTYGISFVQGGTFSVDDAEKSWNNSPKVIINQKAAEQLGFKKDENVIGKKILWGKPYEIIGLVKDYHHLSLRETIQPAIHLASVSYGFFTIRTSQQNMASKISTIKKLYNEQFQGNPFEYFFADESYDKQYTQEQKLGRIFIAAALIAGLIAGMGLFGLATFSAQQRIKEIGIRKVLGASVTQITTLLSKDFVKLVIIAFIIASPIAGYVMNKWLQNFAYKVTISWWIFLSAGIIAIIIAILTVGFQAVKAAVANPSDSLRTE